MLCFFYLLSVIIVIIIMGAVGTSFYVPTSRHVFLFCFNGVCVFIELVLSVGQTPIVTLCVLPLCVCYLGVK